MEFLEAGHLSEAAHDRFNQRVNDHFEGTRDYIVTRYKTNTGAIPSIGVQMPRTRTCRTRSGNYMAFGCRARASAPTLDDR